MTPAPVEILVVDDNPANLVALDAVLAQPDVTVVRAASGVWALALLQAHAYALVILDVKMPGMDGFEVARRIRQGAGRQSPPIIFLTAYDFDPPQVLRAYASGAVDVMFKPFDPDILRSKVSVFVELFRNNRELLEENERLRTAQVAAVTEARRQWEAAATQAPIEREPDQAGAHEIAEPPPRPPRSRVLVVDDNAEIRSTVQIFLQLEGHSVETADCGRAALEQISQTHPDVVLLDLGLPDVDGYTIARQIRAIHHDPPPRLVAMTGSVGARDRKRARRAGFDAHLCKPIDGRTLLRAVEEGDGEDPAR